MNLVFEQPAGLLLLVCLAGLLPACALLLPRLAPAALVLAPWAALPALVLALAAAPGLELELPWVLLGARLGLDDTGRVFLGFTALLWLIAGIYARGYLRRGPTTRRFAACFLLALTGNLGLVVALDMATFYCFFALMSFASYGLIVHGGDPEANRAARIYMVMVVLGELLLFTAFVTAALATDHITVPEVAAGLAASPRRDLVVGLVLAGFGVKAGALPLHVWLPLAHPAAPTPASAVLSGAMIKAGLLGWLRFLPLGAVALPGWAALVMVAGAAAVFFGAAAGVVQRDPKAVLAYSSVSQMGLMTLALALGLAAPEHWPLTLAAVQLYALHHALAKGALFLGVGAAATPVSRPWQRIAVAVGLVLPALALAGAPWTSGAAAKTALKAAATVAPAPWPARLAWLLPLGAVATTLLMARFLVVVWPQGQVAPHPLRRSAVAAWAALVVCSLAAPWLVFGAAIRETLSLAAVGSALTPLLVGAALAWLVARSSRARRVGQLLALPPGDLVVPIELAWYALRRRLREGPEETRSRWLEQTARTTLERALTRAGEAVAACEQLLARWTVGGSVFLALTGMLAWLLLR